MLRFNLPPEQEAEPLLHISKHYAPEIVKAGFAFSTAVYQHSKLSTRECEAARARTAEINGCLLCQKFRVNRDLPGFLSSQGGDAGTSIAHRGSSPDEAFYQNVSNWRDYPDYSERERLAIAYAEGMGLDPKGVADDETLWKQLKAHYSDNEIVDLTYAIASWMSMGRAAHVLGMDTGCSLFGE